jgi:replicative DNA helicase
MFSEGAEQGLVAKLLLDPRKIALVNGLVSPEDFYVSDYRQAYRVMLELAAERKPFDIVALQSAGVDVDVLDLTPAHHAPIEEYAATIKEKAFRRSVMGMADRLGRAAEDGDSDLMVVLQESLAEVIRGTDAGGMTTPTQAVEDYLGTLAGRMAGEGVGLTYGIPGMDERLLPAEPGELIVMAARPSVGKSAMAENVADHWSRLGKGPVLFVSLEMKKTKIMDRTLSRYTGISANKIIRGDLTAEELELVKAEAEKLRSRPIIWLDNGFATSGDVRAAAAKAKMLNDGKLAAIVVDYMQILKDMPGSDLRHKVTFISSMLKAIAVENECPVLALSQFSRSVAVERRDPELTDLRESGAIEQDSDVVIAMTRNLESPVMGVHILKQRQGSVSKFGVHFDGDHSLFKPLSTWSNPLAAEAKEDSLEW